MRTVRAMMSGVHRVALSIVGGLMGLATGLVLMQPVAAFFGATTITWNASSCPAGIYKITSFVRGDDGIVAHSVTTSNVSLPKASVTQQFPNLPARVWHASAITTGEGRAFRSSVQSLQGQGTDDGRVGRSRPTAAPVVGLARPRNSPPVTPPTEPRSTAPTSGVAQAKAADAGSRPVSAGAAAPRLEVLQADLAADLPRLTLAQVVRQLLERLGANLGPEAPEAAALPWRHLVIEDIDGDGVLDVVTIEWADGGVIAVRLHINVTVARLP